ncbi:MAG: tryptophan halogenase family protein [Cellvibrio sp.]|uniref:tryptophan halogenase family protein n=1 Tax=Cellvibrio sp. TaxID=1965322 RepID=UPI0031B02C05
MNPINKIVIVGGGTAGWITAAALANKLSREVCSIELVESEEIGTIGVGESTIPPFVEMLRTLGIDEQDFISKTQGSFKLGIRFANWRTKDDVYFHPFGRAGANIGHYDFFQLWLKTKLQGGSYELMDFSPCNIMAKHGRFFLPQKAPKTPIASASYALHMDAKLVAAYLRKYAEAHGVVRTEGMVTEVKQKDNGFIKSIVLKDGREVEGQLFVDCSGFRALMIEKTLGVGYHDWSDYLPCNRAIAVQTENVDATPPFTKATAQDAGWIWKIPLQHRSGNGYVYANQYISDDEARATLLKNLQGEMIMEPVVIPFITGVRKEPWKYNCVSVGLSSGFIEPLESTAIHLAVRAVNFLLTFFPDQECEPALINEFNRRMIYDYEEIRDFIVMHYCTTERDDTPFWKFCKNMELPQSLKERLELFKSHGILRDGTDELFRFESWQAVLEGMQIRPRKYHPRIDNMNIAEITPMLDRAIVLLDELVQKLPTHDEFLQEFCPAPKMEFKKVSKQKVAS